MSDIQSKVNTRLTQVADSLTNNKTAVTIPFDPNSTKFPSRKDVPRREDAPEGALNLLTPTRVVAASSEIQSGEIVPLNLPLNVPEVPAFNREPFQHSIKELAAGVAYDDTYTLNTQSSTQWDGFRHISHIPSGQFYNKTTAKDIVGAEKDDHKCGIHHWAEHDPFDYHTISYAELQAAGKAQGIDIRPASQGGHVQIGDLLFVRSGFVSTYHTKSPEARKAAALRPHGIGPEDEQRWAGLKQDEEMIDWLHDCYFSAVAGDAPAFEALPSQEHYMLHEYILALWGMPVGEMFDLEKLAKTCREKGRWSFFVTSAPNNCQGGVSSHGNAIAIF